MGILKDTAQLCLPPIVTRGIRYLRYQNYKDTTLFDGNDSLFKSLLKETEIYGEYGCGKSTIWVLKYTRAKIYSVDSDQKWVQAVMSEAKEPDRFIGKWVNLGKVKDSGRPASYSRSQHFKTYANWLWIHNEKPSVVLVDGRFRVLCFLTSLIYANEGTKILFDDYKNREHYHIVEEFVKPTATCGRQALFEVPPKASINVAALNELIIRFEYVMD